MMDDRTGLSARYLGSIERVAVSPAITMLEGPVPGNENSRRGGGSRARPLDRTVGRTKSLGTLVQNLLQT